MLLHTIDRNQFVLRSRIGDKLFNSIICPVVFINAFDATVYQDIKSKNKTWTRIEFLG